MALATVTVFTGRVGVTDEVRESRDERVRFLETGQVSTRVRSVVAESWMRSAAAGVNPDNHIPPLLLERSDLIEYRAAHLLSRVFPLLYDVLGRAAEDCDCAMAVGDASGKLLWVCGPPGVLRRAESINFVEGAAWDETQAGTNAPGTALHLNTAVQIHAGEHFNRLIQPWSCTAAPIHDPSTQEILGIVDITGGEAVASPQTLGMVRAAARMPSRSWLASPPSRDTCGRRPGRRRRPNRARSDCADSAGPSASPKSADAPTG